MKKVLMLILMLSFTAFTFADNSAEFNEEMGIDTNSHTTSSEVRTIRDIPAGGLLLIPDSGGDRVMAFYPDTGNLYDANFVPSDPTNLATPIAAALHPDGHSILVSDQLKDGLIEYDLNGTFLGWFAPAGGPNTAIIDNVRGWGVKADGNILVTSASGTNADAIAEFDATGNYVGNFIAIGAGGMDSPFCVLYRTHENDYLVSTSSSNAIHRYDASGTYLNDLVTGMHFPEQIAEVASGNILVAGFSTPSGCYEYTNTGVYVGYFDVVSGLRGVYELGNGNILVTNASGVYEINRSNQLVSTKMTDVNARFIYFADGGGISVDDPQQQPQIKNFPNPMKNATTISFTHKQNAGLVVQIYNTKGQLVNELHIHGNQNSVVWDGTRFDGNLAPNGIYLYRIETSDNVISNKLLLLR
ncbi:MAG TPA: T9SS type A sorting domain-containing protein [Candidatus Cloacimonetes bacterium]|nr:T9SS type A sorting domain-containing protein [Candidatus Cloacimonadota bacterium]